MFVVEKNPLVFSLSLVFGVTAVGSAALAPADAHARMPKSSSCPACEIVEGGGEAAGPAPTPVPGTTPAPFDEGEPLGPPVTEPKSDACPACQIVEGGGEVVRDAVAERAPEGFGWIAAAFDGVMTTVAALNALAEPGDALDLPDLAEVVADLLPLHAALGPASPAFSEALNGEATGGRSLPAFAAAYTGCVASPSCVPDADGATALLAARGAAGHPATDHLALALGCLGDDACLAAADGAERHLRWAAGATHSAANAWRHSAAAVVFGAVCVIDDDCRAGLPALRDLAEALSPSGTDDLAGALLAAGRAAGADLVE